ncbi:uncharacterized protein LOC111289650 [Durio zibethinus]|uniref:Uncharacterized protein LOC111289650 n=1 Tax=Durio zibethinus TaxID=66656 RepID=A0A6P5Y816_DURZI|nr:uncharacterized protein LOC111289650 [Durio zibethinus]XP_022736614.1 uncharacterized protein LOC111289650 [Durio zibethinus]
MAVKNIVFQLAEESKRLTDIEPYLARKIQELDNIVGQYETEEAERGNCISQWQFKIQAMLESFNHGSESSHTDKQYSDEFVQDFVEKLDDNEKSRVHFPDFKGLTEELEKSGRLNLPPSLVPVHETLKKAYRDITAESNQSIPVIRFLHSVLLCDQRDE